MPYVGPVDSVWILPRLVDSFLIGPVSPVGVLKSLGTLSEKEQSVGSCGFAAAVTTPLDVAKTRIMLAKAGSSPASGNVLSALHGVWRTRGLSGSLLCIIRKERGAQVQFCSDDDMENASSVLQAGRDDVIGLVPRVQREKDVHSERCPAAHVVCERETSRSPVTRWAQRASQQEGRH
eukprot:bmy_10594T0